jgi:serine protease Do
LLIGPVSRAFARRALDILEANGIAFDLRPARVAPPSALSRNLAVVGAFVGLGVGIGAAVMLLHQAPTANPPNEPKTNLVEATSNAAAPTGPTAPTSGRADAGGANPVELSTQAIGQKVLPSVVALSCKDKLGSGFFIDAETVITNAHVACPEGEDLKVHLHDGRDLVGVVQERDEWLDSARVRVVGAATPPLEVGEVSALVPGDRVVFAGSPSGLEFTLHEGQVSYVGRNYLGIAYIQINASVNPGNSGGPLFDKHGRVVGIVSMKVTKTDGIGLALPIQYVVPPATPEALRRWASVIREASEADSKEVEQFRSRVDQPFLVGVPLDERYALVIQRWHTSPGTAELDFDVESKDKVVCTLHERVEKWVPLVEALKKHPGDRQMMWAQRNGLTEELFVGGGPLRGENCMVGDAELVLRDHGVEHGRVPISDASVRAATRH